MLPAAGAAAQALSGGALERDRQAAAALEPLPASFEHLTAADGLPQSTVYATLQDSRGYLWLGTQDGLVRYDGQHLYRYPARQSAAGDLPGTFIQALAEDAHHDVWIATADAGVARWNRDSDRFTVFRHEGTNPGSLGSDVAIALAIDPAGLVWVGTRDAGVDVINPAAGRIQHLRHDPRRPDSLIDDRVQSLARGLNGEMWVGTDAGLDLLRRGAGGFLHASSAGLTMRAASDSHQPLYVDASGSLWQALPDAGLIRRDTTGAIVARYRHAHGDALSLSSDAVHAILQDGDGRLWVGTAEGLDLLDPGSGGFTHYRHDDRDPNSLTDSDVVSLYEDAAGNLWIGTRLGGVNHHNPRSWRFGPRRPPWLHGREVTSFAEADGNRIWIGSAGGGLVRFDPATGGHDSLEQLLHRDEALGDGRVMSLERDASGALWIGTQASGLWRLDRDGRLTAIPVSPGSDRGLSAPGIMTLHAGRDGRVWIGTYGGGANVLDPRSGRVQQLPTGPAPPALSSAKITAFAEESSGSVWIGTDAGGLDLADPAGRVLRAFRHRPRDRLGLPSDTVYAITVDLHGRIWVGTDRGLTQVVGSAAHPDAIRFRTLGAEEGIPTGPVWGILSDAGGRLWISGNSGITRFDPDRGSVRSYHVEHGLQGEEFDFGAYRKLPDGRLAFGGPGGFNLFEPSAIIDSSVPPPIALTRVEVLGVPLRSARPYWMLQEIAVDSDARIVTLGFAALDFTSVTHNRLAYRLPKLSDRWIELGGDHALTLTNMDSGEHLIEVRAASADSNWSPSPLHILVRKKPPPWASPPAWGLYSLAAAGCVAWLMRARTRRRAQSERIERLAFYDALTGLPNRQRCLEVAAQMIEEANRSGESVSFICLDLDGVKRINDTFGHAVGDSVLRNVAERLGAVIRTTAPTDSRVLLSRFGGDEFVVVAQHASAEELGQKIARTCQASLSAPLSHSRLEFLARPSIGLAVYPSDGQDAGALLKHADTAMYHAKAAGAGGIAVYEQSMSARLHRYVQLEGRLRRAILDDMLCFELQPKFRLASRQITGAEVLARWIDLELGEVSPVDFIAVAEESSLIIALGEWVMRAACRQLAAWQREAINLPLAINVSAKELLYGDPARTLEQEARAAGVSPALIEIEITESLLARESSTVRAGLDRLRALGCSIALDDFGTGYSSLAYITRFPPDRIKIDKAFVRRLDRPGADCAIASAILSLGASLNAVVTAEGIEREGQLTWLCDHGCEEGQGFLLSRPLLPPVLTRLLAGASPDGQRSQAKPPPLPAA